MRKFSITYALIIGLFIAMSAQGARGEDAPKVDAATPPAAPVEQAAQPAQLTQEEIDKAKAAELEKQQAEEQARAEAEERKIRLEELEKVKADELKLREMDAVDNPQSQPMHIRGMAPLKSKPEELLAFKINELADALARNLKEVNSDLFVATFVDLDRMNRSNSFGRYITEGLMEKMHNLGYGVVELRASDRIMSQPAVGMHVLNIQPGEIANYNADTYLSGTYKKAGDVLEVHAKVVSHSTKKVLASASFEIAVEKDNAFMQDLLDNPIGRASVTTGKVEKGK